MNPRTLRALLPVLREAREAGVRRIAHGEGKDRIEVELAPPEPSSVNAHLSPEEDVAAEDAEQEGDPRFFLEKFVREGGYTNPGRQS